MIILLLLINLGLGRSNGTEKLTKSFESLIGTCVLFRTHSISEVRFRETNYDAGAEKIRFHSHTDKTQFSLLHIVIEDSV